MTDTAPPGWIYNETARLFATPGDPPFEDTAELEKYWGRPPTTSGSSIRWPWRRANC